MSDTLDWPVHPAAELFPLMEGDDFDKLVADIRDNGLMEPVWLWLDPDRDEQVLLDGRNRARACKRAAVPVRTRAYTGKDALAFVTSQNVMRRHMTKEDLLKVALALEPMFAEQAARRMKAGKPNSDPAVDRQQGSAKPTKRHRTAGEEAATAVGLTGTMLHRYKRLRKEAADLADLVDERKLSLSTAYVVLRLQANGHADLARQVLDGKLPVKEAERAITTKPKPESVTQKDRAEQIRVLAEQGKIAAEIGPALGLKPETVHDIAKKYGIKVPRERSANRTADRIRELAAQGHSSSQIAGLLNCGEQWVRRLAQASQIEIPADKVMRGRRRPESNRIVEQTINTLANLEVGIELVNYSDLDVSQVPDWLTSLDNSLELLKRFRSNIKKVIE